MHKNPEMQKRIERALVVSKKLHSLVSARQKKPDSPSPRHGLKLVKK